MPLALNFLRKEHFDSVATMFGGQKELFLMFLPAGWFICWGQLLASAFRSQVADTVYYLLLENAVKSLENPTASIAKFLIFLTGYFKYNWFGIYNLDTRLLFV